MAKFSAIVSGMRIPVPGSVYLVGGAVRDWLLGLEPMDKDYVVVGASANEMLSAGFKQVGAHFPVFLSPEGVEYALARQERKTGPGHTGFECVFSPETSLEEDLERRDLTINAMAISCEETLIDPYRGHLDLRDGILRHVTDRGFIEDPLRVLRLARFYARYPKFTVADSTYRLVVKMVQDGALNELSKERITGEISKVLLDPTPGARPSRFFSLLREVGALRDLIPSLAKLFFVDQSPIHHPEGNVFQHTMLALDWAKSEYSSVPQDDLERVLYGVLFHDIGKIVESHGHELHGVQVFDQVCDSDLVLSSTVRRFVRMAIRQHMKFKRALELRPGTIHDLFEDLKAFREPNNVLLLRYVCTADDMGRGQQRGSASYNYSLADVCRCGTLLEACFEAARGITAQRILDKHPDLKSGPWVGEQLRQERIAAIKSVQVMSTL